MSFGGLSSSPKHYLQTPSVKKETRRVAVKRNMDLPVKLFLRTARGNDWDKICGVIVGFTQMHACVAEGCNVKKYIIKEPQLLPDRIYIRTPQAGGKGWFICMLLLLLMKWMETS